MAPVSGIAWSRLPALQLGPVVRLADDLPDVGGLGVGVARAVKGKLPGQAPLHSGELGRGMGVTAQVIAQQQGYLLGEASSAPDMKMGPAAAGGFAEVPLGALGVVRAVDISQPFERILECLDGLEGVYRDLHVDDRLGGQAGTPIASGIPLGSGGRRMAVGPFDELAVFETGAGADQRDQMGRVHGAPAG